MCNNNIEVLKYEYYHICVNVLNLWFAIPDRFSFGDPHGSIIQPLEGDEKTTDNGKTAFQLFYSLEIFRKITLTILLQTFREIYSFLLNSTFSM